MIIFIEINSLGGDLNRQKKVCNFYFNLNTVFRALIEKDDKKKNNNMPFRWMSLETFERRIYTQASDVWSFGIVMWEIFTFGKMPYNTLENDKILKFLQEVRF